MAFGFISIAGKRLYLKGVDQIDLRPLACPALPVCAAVTTTKAGFQDSVKIKRIKGREEGRGKREEGRTLI